MAPRHEQGGGEQRQGEVIGLALGQAELARHVAEAVLEDQRAADGRGGTDEDQQGRRRGAVSRAARVGAGSA